MKSLISLFFVMLLAISCSDAQKDSWRDSVAEGLSGAGSEVVAVALTCENKSAIKADVKAELLKLDILKPSAQKSTAGIICQAATMAVLPAVMGEGLDRIPAEWGCSASKIEMGLSELAKEACAKL